MEIGYSIGDRQAEDRFLPAAIDAGAKVLAARPVGGGRDPLFRLVQGKPLPDFAKEIEVDSWHSSSSSMCSAIRLSQQPSLER